MIKRLLKNEDGVALGLAVILIVIIGVMGAGLLVFVRNDLQAVVQVNQGQEAFEMSDSGIETAKRQLLSNACPESYDGEGAGGPDEDNPCADSEESDWSYAPAVSDENDSASGGDDEAGKELTFDGTNDSKKVDVSIRHLKPTDDADEARSSCDTLDTPNNEPDECFAPEVESESPQSREYFQIESTGVSSNGDAKRRVEAIFYTTDLGHPKAYYSPSAISLRGNSACIEGISVFSLDSITLNSNGTGGGCDSGGNITGEDLAYGDWKNDFNATERNTREAGFGAVNEVDVNEPDEQGSRDADQDSAPSYNFVAEPSNPQESDEITFPFDHESQSGQADQDRLDFLEQRARDQGNYRTGSSINDWPDDADDRTVVYIEASGGTVDWKINRGGGNSGCPGGDALKGTLVVDGASLKVAGNKKSFSGVTIVHGGTFNSRGNSCWGGPVSADGGIEIRGNASPSVSESLLDRPGFYGVEQWSWRELYE